MWGAQYPSSDLARNVAEENDMELLAKRSTLPALLLILYVPKVGDYRDMIWVSRIWNY